MSSNFDEIFLKMQKSSSDLRANRKHRFRILENGSDLSVAALTEEKSNTSNTKDNSFDFTSASEASSMFKKDERFEQFLKKTPNIVYASDLVYTFVHGDSIREPIEYISQAKFTKEIHQNLNKSGYRVVIPIQAYSWNEILSGRAVTIVNPKCSGKTMAYLPSLLTLLTDIDDENENSQGPVGIIFVSSSREVETVYKLCRKMVDFKKISIVTAFGKWNCAQKQMKLLNGVHLLITTPPCFIRLSSQVEDLKIFDRDRVKCLVFDNFDVIYEKFQTDLLDVMKMLTRGADHPEDNPQIIITTTKWMSCNKNMLKLSCRPIVIIGDHIEAGIFAKSRFIVKRMSLEEKQKSLLAHLKSGDYRVEKTIVFVKNELELNELLAICRNNFIDCDSLNAYDSIDNQHYNNEEVWKHTDENKLKVVLATDKAMVNYRVKNAQVIIHYSLPLTWSVFSKRFSASFGFYKKILSLDKPSPANSTPKAVIMMDQNNLMEIPRMISFLRDHRLVKFVPQEIVELINEITQDLERHKVETQFVKRAEICSNMLKFGKCTAINCSRRHAFIKEFDNPQHLPTTGVIKFRLYAVKSPLHFVIKIKESCASENCGEWTSWKEQNKEIEAKLNELQELMGDSDNRVIHAPIVVDEMCAYFHVRDVKWYRAKVINVGTPHEDNPFKYEVKIHLIDKGEKITVRSTLLLKLDDSYKAFRPLVFELRILNFIPFDSDDYFDEETLKQMQNIFNQRKYNGNYVVSKISLSLQNTVFTKNFHVMKFLPNLKSDVVQLHLKDLLISKDYAIRDDEIALRILMLAENGKLVLPREEEPVKVNIEAPKVDVIEIAPKWEQLEDGKDYNVHLGKFISPEDFYVRLSDKFNSLQIEMANIGATKLLKNIKKDVYCLFVPEKTRKLRAKITNDDDLEIFLLDVGFSITNRSLHEMPLSKMLYEMPSELIAKDIRFTAVKCMIAGVIPKFNKDTWDDRYSLAFKCLLRDLSKDGIIEMRVENKVDTNFYEVSFYNYKEDKDIVEIAVEEGFANSKQIKEEIAQADFERLFLNVGALETMTTSQLNQLIGLPETARLLPPPALMPKEKPTAKAIDPISSSKNIQKASPIMPQNRRSRFVIEEESPVKTQPKLVPLYKHPYIEWYQKELIVGLKITFIDAEDYSLEIDESSVSIYIKYPKKSLEFAKIYLYGLIVPQYCSHSKNDNFIRVRLLKRAMNAADWPRLTYTNERNNFIKFREEKTDVAEEPKKEIALTEDINWMPVDYYDNEDDENQHYKEFDDDINKPEMI